MSFSVQELNGNDQNQQQQQQQPQSAPASAPSPAPASGAFNVSDIDDEKKPTVINANPDTEAQAAARSEEYKKKAWAGIVNGVHSGDLKTAASSFLSLFTNPDEAVNPVENIKGVVKGAGQGVNALSELASKFVPSIVRPQDVHALAGLETPTNPSQEMGAGLEQIAEFALGEEGIKAVEGLSYAQKLSKLLPMMKQLEASPKLFRIMKAAYNTAKMAGLTSAVSAAHAPEGQRAEAAKEGAIGGAMFGAGGEAVGAGLGALTEGIQNKLGEAVRPVMKDVAGQQIPVRPEGRLADIAAKSVAPEVLDQATAKTAAAVQQGVGEVTKGAVGSEAETAIGDRDRFGVRAHAEDLKQSSVPAFQKLDELSNNAFSDAQEIARKSAKDFSTEGRDKFETATKLQEDIMETHRQELKDAGYDVDEMKGNYRKQIALNKIADRLDTATSAKAGGGYEVDGNKMANTIDKLRRAPAGKNLFDKAGFKPEHVDALAQLADTLREQQDKPEFGGLTKLAAKALAITSFGHNITGLAEALTGESMAEKLGSKVMTKVFGDAMTSEPAARQLNQALKNGPQGLSTWDAFKQAAVRLWQDERGELGAPGTVGVTGRTPEAEISTRSITSGDEKKGTFKREPNDSSFVTGWDAIEHAERERPGYKRDLLDKVLSYKDNGLNLTDEEKADPDKGLKAVINHWSDNLVWLHDNMPPELRDIAKQWYDSAHTMTKNIAERTGTTHPKVAGVVAVMSPQNPWDLNVGQAERLVTMYQTMRDHPFTPEMDSAISARKAKALKGAKPNVEFAKDLEGIRGKTYDQMPDRYHQALWLRMVDESHGNTQTPVYAPDGKIRGYQTFNWGLTDPIAKGIDIMESDGSAQAIHDIIGDGHKIRNFYNNIISPNSELGHATIDTHHVNADMLKPMSSKNDIEVKDNFGGSPGSKPSGQKGTYSLHHEALKQAAAKRGLYPREMQSISWEAIKTLMGDEKKTPELRKAVTEIWQQHQAGELTLDQARSKIVEAAGGFDEPGWAKERKSNGQPEQSNTGSNEKGGSSPDAGELPVLGVRGESPSGPRTGSGGNIPRAVPETRPRTVGSEAAFERVQKVGAKGRRPSFGVQNQVVTMGTGPTQMSMDIKPTALTPEVMKWKGQAQPPVEFTPKGNIKAESVHRLADYANANAKPEDIMYTTAHEIAHSFIQHDNGWLGDDAKIGLGHRAMFKGRSVDGGAKASMTSVSGGYLDPGKGLNDNYQIAQATGKTGEFVRDYVKQLMAGRAMEELLGIPEAETKVHIAADVKMAQNIMKKTGIPSVLHERLLDEATTAAKKILTDNFDTVHHIVKQSVNHYGGERIDGATFHKYRKGGVYGK